LMHKFILTLCCLLAITTVFSQGTNTTKTIKLSGTVIDDASKQPLEYATIVLKNTATNAITGGITNENGKFDISVPSAKYQVSIKFISFETKTYPAKNYTENTNFGTVTISEDMSSLDEVVVIAEKTTVDIRLEKRYLILVKIYL
jgi:hypothetical protein